MSPPPNEKTAPELQALRRAVERDRYGLMAYVLMARDHCTPASCAAFRSLADSRQIAANMDERVYENLITRYAASWNAPPAPAAGGLIAGLPPSVPTGKPTNAEFPSSRLDPAGQHHDARTRPAAAKPPAAKPRCAGIAGRAAPRPARRGIAAGAGGRQEAAAGTEACRPRRAGPDRAGARPPAPHRGIE